MRTLIKIRWNLSQSNNYTHIQPYSPLPRYNVVATDTAIVAIMTEVFINIVSGEGGPTLWSIYENVSKNNLFAMFVRVNLSMIVVPKRESNERVTRTHAGQNNLHITINKIYSSGPV